MNWLIYSSENNQYTVKIRTRVVEEVLNECKKSLNIETGGILIGTYTDDLLCALINSICKAPKDSKKTRTMFKRGVYGLLSFLDKKWEETGEYYLGEWHYHPNSLPQPSRKDISQMKKLST
jgi:integrative and conjugative element protein (TIGR02256 family)